jgi:hypothetical protein
VVFYMGRSSVIVSLIVPYSCMVCRMCSAYADWGLLFLDVAYVFAVSGCETSGGLSYVHFVACSAC